ncbi:MAG: DciA family protein [Burkholderiales bacterium]|nr:DciA family protein [Burkholderiales bacterium]
MALKTPTHSKPIPGSKPIRALLRENETLLPFHEQLRQISGLQKTFVDALPPGLSESCRIATVEGSTIIVATANGAVAAKLKQMLPRLLGSFRETIGENKKQYQEVTGISVIVQPEFFVAEMPPKLAPPRAPIPTAKLAELAESLGDSPLKTTLEALANKRQRALTNKKKPG